MTNSVNQRCTVRRQSTKLLVFFSFFNVALSPQRPYGLLGRRSAGRQPRLSHSVPELWTTKPDTTDVYTNVWPFRRQERCLGGELCSCQSLDCTSMSFHLTVVLATWRTMCHHLYVFTSRCSSCLEAWCCERLPLHRISASSVHASCRSPPLPLPLPHPHLLFMRPSTRDINLKVQQLHKGNNL